MHPFFLSKTIWIIMFICIIIGPLAYEKVHKKELDKTRIIVYGLTLIIVLTVCVHLLMYLIYDYSVIFPNDYFQGHDYIVLFLGLLPLLTILSQEDLDINALDRRRKVLLILSLVYLLQFPFIPAGEKIYDRYQYSKATSAMQAEGTGIETVVTANVPACRESPPYRKFYLLIDCLTQNDRFYYVFAKNHTKEVQHLSLRVVLFDLNGEEVNRYTSDELALESGAVDKVVFDGKASQSPNWMQHSFVAEAPASTYRIEVSEIE